MRRPASMQSVRPLVRRVTVPAIVVGFAAAAAVALVAAPEADAADRRTVMQAAAAYGARYDYKVGIAVYDTRTNRLYGSGAYKSTFASESVIKVMIATRLLVQGRMHGTTAKRAYKMITRSDDAIASAFYGSVGGDSLINWVKRRYHVPDLGTPPSRAGWWGNTHITPAGLVKFYAKVKKDGRVAGWLLNAMHHAKPYGSDGTYQFFGLPSATTGAAVKQGWGTDYDDWGRSADFNTTGYVNGDRYAVAILARGPARTYGGPIGRMLTRTARLLLPGGHFPDPPPTITSMSHRSGSTAGGQRITIRGTDFTHVTAVVFGKVKGTAVRVASRTSLSVTSPPHRAKQVTVRVVTNHGRSGTTGGSYLYVRPPAVTSVSPSTGPVAGGTTVTITGTDFGRASAVYFGTARASFTRVSGTKVTAVAPPGVAGTVDVLLQTAYGRSRPVPEDRYTYAG